MRRVFIVIVDHKSLTDSLVSRIEQLGDFYRFAENIYFVCPNDPLILNARLVFETIIGHTVSYPYVSVFQLTSNEVYWGYASRDLWTWIHSHIQNG